MKKSCALPRRDIEEVGLLSASPDMRPQVRTMHQLCSCAARRVELSIDSLSVIAETRMQVAAQTTPLKPSIIRPWQAGRVQAVRQAYAGAVVGGSVLLLALRSGLVTASLHLFSK